MFSIARSRYTLAIQFLFLVTNAVGLLLGITYNAKTPDLYPNNAHHKLGWLVTWVVSAQVVISLISRIAGAASRSASSQAAGREEEEAFIPVSTEAMAEHQRMNGPLLSQQYRSSNDSGQGTEPHTESLRSNSVSTTIGRESPIELSDRGAHYEDEEEDLHFKPEELLSSKAPNSFIAKWTSKIPSRAWKVLMFIYNFIDRTILILGYIALCTGIITFARFFVSQSTPRVVVVD